jgi:hypothetical protein
MAGEYSLHTAIMLSLFLKTQSVLSFHHMLYKQFVVNKTFLWITLSLLSTDSVPQLHFASTSETTAYM